MSSVELSKQLRAVLSQLPDATPLTELIELVDAKVTEISTSEGTLLHQFEEDLQDIYHEVVNHESLYQLEVFLYVLYHSQPVLSSTSLISTWFDLALRPGLREPRLASSAVEHAKELVLTALEKVEDSPEKVGEFRRRVLDLYLLDALNESSGDDIMEWAELDEGQRERRVWWKTNLEDTLVRFGLQRPKELMTGLYHCFMSPTCRLQILILLDSLISHPSFIDVVPTLGSHPLLSALLLSLQLDGSSTVCTFGVTVLVKLLPIMAVKACKDLKRILPSLLSILARLICWKGRKQDRVANIISYSDLDDHCDESLIEALEQTENEEENAIANDASRMQLHVREDLAWECLDHPFDSKALSTPSPDQYYAFLYYLFPCNVIAFLRRPASYLTEMGEETPYTIRWEEALDEIQIRTGSEPLLRRYVTHPSIIWRDARTELEQSDHWVSYNVARIVGECNMLEVGNVALALREGATTKRQPVAVTPAALGDDSQTPRVKAVELPTKNRKHQISIQDMIMTSVALKSGADFEIVDAAPLWPSQLIASTSSPANAPVSTDDSVARPSHAEEAAVPRHVVETISSLQREVLLLRNELNFELWLKKENVQHVGRLHQDRVTSKGAELERQGLHNKLREYKGQMMHMRKQLKNHQDQASRTTQKNAEWHLQLQSKLIDLRDQKKSWMTEATALRSENVEAKAHLAAQGLLLAEAQNKVFQLETEIKEDAHKVQRLRDYEKRIEQLTAMHRMWNEDVRLYNEQAKYITVLISDFQKMQLRLESYEKTQMEMDKAARANRIRVQSLESELRRSRQVVDKDRRDAGEAVGVHSAEVMRLSKANERMRVETGRLSEEVEELKAAVEVLKWQVAGKKGLALF